MCGFVGVLQSRARGPVSAQTLRALLPLIRHRGPDQEGVYVSGGFGVAATRLRVRGGAEGDQPVVAGGRALAFNGEILFQTAGVPAAGSQCDTPELLAFDGEFGELLDGNMGALVRFDPADRRLDLARDALGVKPLYVAELDDGTVWFASEMRALLASVPAQADPDGLAELLHFHRPRARLPLAGVRELPRGVTTSYGVDAQGYRASVQPPVSAPRPAAPRFVAVDAPSSVRAAWTAAARAAADVDGPVSLLLSGGLDSAAVAAWAGRDDLLCLTGRFGPEGGAFDESAEAASVAAHLGLPHEIVDLRDEDLVSDLPAVVRALELPIAGPGSLALWRMAQRARAHGRVVLTGTGGDELFGGYARVALVAGRAGPWTRGYEPLRARIEQAGADPAGRMRAAFDRSADLQPLLDPAFVRTLGWPVTAPLLEDASLLRSMLWEERNGTLRSLLHVEDRVLMAHGLEGRPVGCLGELPAVAAALPDAWLVGPDGEGKRALRAALAGAIPEAVRTDVRKRGFPTPFARAARGAGREQVLDWLHERRFVQRGWWNVDACRALLDAETPAWDRALFAVLSWEWWARWVLDGDALRADTGASRQAGGDGR
ncbi:MAG: asparagine synthase-related protein [Planctomycetota bacterium]|nr:asparagine synthase-related protein [Planctomycetota bacterium]